MGARGYFITISPPQFYIYNVAQYTFCDVVYNKGQLKLLYEAFNEFNGRRYKTPYIRNIFFEHATLENRFHFYIERAQYKQGDYYYDYYFYKTFICFHLFFVYKYDNGFK